MAVQKVSYLAGTKAGDLADSLVVLMAGRSVVQSVETLDS